MYGVVASSDDPRLGQKCQSEGDVGACLFFFFWYGKETYVQRTVESVNSIFEMLEILTCIYIELRYSRY